MNAGIKILAVGFFSLFSFNSWAELNYFPTLMASFREEEPGFLEKEPKTKKEDRIIEAAKSVGFVQDVGSPLIGKSRVTAYPPIRPDRAVTVSLETLLRYRTNQNLVVTVERVLFSKQDRDRILRVAEMDLPGFEFSGASRDVIDQMVRALVATKIAITWDPRLQGVPRSTLPP